MTVRYTVNTSIIYNPADGNLQHIEGGDLIALPLPAQRLLQILLDSEGELISREDLLKKVWDQYGLNGSGNNLNQYLSIIRRSFTKLGCEAFIETIPRVGVRLFESVIITKEENFSTAPPVRKEKKHRLSEKKRILLSSLMLPLSVAALLALFLGEGISFSYYKVDPSYITIPLDGGCQLVTFSHLPAKEMTSVKHYVSNYLKKYEKKCEPGLAIYFDNISTQNLDTYVRTLIAVCDRNKDDEDVVCSNDYYINGVVDED